MGLPNLVQMGRPPAMDEKLVKEIIDAMKQRIIGIFPSNNKVEADQVDIEQQRGIPSHVVSPSSSARRISYKEVVQRAIAPRIKIAKATQPPFGTFEGLKATLSADEWERILFPGIMPREICIVKSIEELRKSERGGFHWVLEILNDAWSKRFFLRVPLPPYHVGYFKVGDAMPGIKVDDCLIVLHAKLFSGHDFTCDSRSSIFRCKVDDDYGLIQQVSGSTADGYEY
ncbi:hypothetical protein [Sporisorium scitamineum]|nr:hypothetical protein [Sporisorium scitamineum]